MSLLMTPTMWDSVDWCRKSPPSWKDRAHQGLLDTLNRKWNPNKAIERGIAFEKAICEGNKNPLKAVAPDLEEKFMAAFELIHKEGGSFQAKTKKFVKYDGKEFLLYGKKDVDFPVDKLTIDIKTTGNYKGEASYLSKWQHKVYSLCDRREAFKYIVFEFNDLGMMIDVHTIDYFCEDFNALENEVMEKLASVVQFLRADPKLEKAYMTKFNLYN